MSVSVVGEGREGEGREKKGRKKKEGACYICVWGLSAC